MDPDRHRRGAVELTDASAKKSIEGAKFAGGQRSGAGPELDLRHHGPRRLPAGAGHHDIVCSKGYDADTAAAVKSFLTVAANDGQANRRRVTCRCRTSSKQRLTAVSAIQ